jgi:cell division protease FtsH
MDPSFRPKNEPAAPSGWSKRIGLALLVLLIAWWAASIFLGGPQRTAVSYSEFRDQLQQGNVQEATIQGREVRGSLDKAITRTTAGNRTEDVTAFTTRIPEFGGDTVLALMEDKGVEVQVEEPRRGDWWIILFSLLPLLLLAALFYAQYRRMKGAGGGGPGGMFNIGKSKAKLYEESDESAAMDDVAGCRGAKTELSETIAYLKDPTRLQRLGGEAPKGVLLVGPPGSGKTLLARAVAGEAQVPFFSITGSDFMEMFVGVGASRVRNMFQEAKKRAPCIVFIDELDSIGRQRGAGLGGGHDEREQTLNQILSEMDGFEPNESVVVMSATNRPDILDPALVRPGRFDRRIIVEMPNTEDRKEILDIHARHKPLSRDVDMEELARATQGFSGADLETLLNEAALLAARAEREEITRQDIEAARDKVLMGLERQGMHLSDRERRMVAYHESGHAAAAALLEHADPVHKVSIIPRTRAMGATQQFPEKERYLYGREYMLDRLAVMMGGRAAEELVFQTSTSGAGNDLKEAAKLARKMVLEWGMSEKFRHMALGGQDKEVFLGSELGSRRDYSEQTAREVDQEVRSILDESFEKAYAVVQEHREGLDKLVDKLLDKEEIQGDRVLEVLGVKKGGSP